MHLIIYASKDTISLKPIMMLSKHTYRNEAKAKPRKASQLAPET